MGKSKAAPKQQRPEPVPTNPWTFLFRHCYWLFPLVLFLTLRLYSSDSFYLLAGDQCTYLELGRTFPKHQLFNHELYLIHPPLFGFAIGLFNLFLPLLASGLVATLLFACVNFFVIRHLARLEDIPQTAIFVGLIYLALSRPAVHYDCHVARVSILAFSTSLAILAFLRFVREPGRQTLVVAVAANVFSLLVSDQALLLLPCEAVIFWARAAIISKFFDSAPRDVGIMAPVLLSPEVVYLTDKRVVALPFDPALLDRFVEQYHITYLLTSSEFLTRYRRALADQYFGALISRFLVEHPDRCRLVRSVQENYAAFYAPITYYLFQVAPSSTRP